LEDFLAGLRFGPFDLVGLFGLLVGVPSEAEEVALDVCPLFRLGRPVMTGERDAARVLRALEDLTNGNASIRLVVTDDRRHVLVSRADQVDEPPPDLRLEESEELAVAGVDRQEALLLAELALSADGVAGEDVARGGIDEPEDAGLAHVLDEEAGLVFVFVVTALALWSSSCVVRCTPRMAIELYGSALRTSANEAFASSTLPCST